MRRIFILLLACSACEPSRSRTLTDEDLPPRTVAQTSLAAAPPVVGAMFQCLQDDSGRVRLTGIIRQRIHTTAGGAPGSARRADTLVVLETPMRTIDCKNRAGGQPPPEFEPRSSL
ncbi:MAG: hypothetical protein IT357_06845 [Gemmatimonadaceae bacterium]|nr:hypothetical protein [Gemmatimonadaceae bacterium]